METFVMPVESLYSIACHAYCNASYPSLAVSPATPGLDMRTVVVNMARRLACLAVCERKISPSDFLNTHVHPHHRDELRKRDLMSDTNFDPMLSVGRFLPPCGLMYAGNFLESNSKIYQLIHQTDGNLVLYE